MWSSNAAFVFHATAGVVYVWMPRRLLGSSDGCSRQRSSSAPDLVAFTDVLPPAALDSGPMVVAAAPVAAAAPAAARNPRRSSRPSVNFSLTFPPHWQTPLRASNPKGHGDVERTQTRLAGFYRTPKTKARSTARQKWGTNE